MNVTQLRSAIAALLTIQDLARMFGVAEMTLHNWRKLHSDPLPTILIPGVSRPSLRFYLGDVQKWAKRNDVPVVRVPAPRKRAEIAA